MNRKFTNCLLKTETIYSHECIDKKKISAILWKFVIILTISENLDNFLGIAEFSDQTSNPVSVKVNLIVGKSLKNQISF